MSSRKKKFATEIDLFRFVREFKDGITFFELSINLDKYHGDHKPSIGIMLIVCNFKVFEFSVYNTYHRY